MILLVEAFARRFGQIAAQDDGRYLEALGDADLQRARAEDWSALLRELEDGSVAA